LPSRVFTPLFNRYQESRVWRRDHGQRALLFDLDMAIQRLRADTPDNPSIVQLTGIYHNLLRRWADV